jgi:hypothetical protein
MTLQFSVGNNLDLMLVDGMHMNIQQLCEWSVELSRTAKEDKDSATKVITLWLNWRERFHTLRTPGVKLRCDQILSVTDPHTHGLLHLMFREEVAMGSAYLLFWVCMYFPAGLRRLIQAGTPVSRWLLMYLDEHFR